MEQLKRQTLFEGAEFIHYQTKRFKTARISIRFALQMNAQTVCAFASLPGLIRYTSAAYPTNMLTERKLASLYGAGFSASAGKLGDTQILSFTISSVADKFAFGNEALGSMCCAFLLDAILKPDFDENGLFKVENLAREKRLMSEAIQTELGDKMAYSLNRFHALFYGEEGAGVPVNGTLEQVAALDTQAVTQAWKTMLETAKIMVCAVGDMHTEKLAQAVCSAFSSISRAYRAPVNLPHLPAPQPRDVHEVQPLEQCKLNLGFCYAGDNEPAAKLMNMIFGGSFMSKLNKQVRETLGLCYYCSSAVGITKKVLMVYCGIESDNRQQAIEAISAQLRAIQSGDVSLTEFEMARKKLKEAYLNFDTPVDITNWYLSHILYDVPPTPEQAWAQIEQTSLEDVIHFAKSVTPDAIYSLGAEI